MAFFSSQLGIDHAGLTPAPAPEENLDWRTMAMVNALGDKVSKLGVLNNSLNLPNLGRQEPLQIGLLMAQEIQERFAASNKRLIKRRKDLNDDDLTPDWTAYDEMPNVYRLEAGSPFGDHLVHVLRHYRQSLRLERARALLTEAALNLSVDQQNAARGKHAQAEKELDIPQCLAELRADLDSLRDQAETLKSSLGVAPKTT